MKYFFLTAVACLVSNLLLSQEVVSPMRYNPYQNPGYQLKSKNDKTSLVRKNLIYQFDTLKLPFKEDFSKNHFPTKAIDTSNLQAISTSLLLRNGNPVNSSARFSTDTTFSYSVYPPDSLSAPIPNSSETITFVDFSVFPFRYVDTTVWPAYSVYDTIPGGIDTSFFPQADLEQKIVTKYLVPVDTNLFWTDHYVYRNNDYPVDPPSIGVVSFDGLDENGLPYDIEVNKNGSADKMTSVPIDISNLNASDSLYLSFYYQPQGRSVDSPDNGDSLLLEFFHPVSEKWEQVWGHNGGTNVHPFEEVFVLVDTAFFSSAFQFRFRNRANLSSPEDADFLGEFDQWHLDYIVLDKERSLKDTIKKDITFVYEAPSFIKDYSSMPWFHYALNPQEFTKDTVEYCFKNRFNQSLNIFYTLKTINTRDSFMYFKFPSGNNTFAIVNGDTSRCQSFSFGGPPSFFPNSIRPGDFEDEEIIETKYGIDFRPTSSDVKDFFPSNDTISKFQVFSNYYSYDDGTAEAGYGIENYPGNVMLNYFKMPVDDSLIALKIYFLPQAYNVTKQKFKIVVYSSLSENGLVYESSQELQPIYTDQNEFAIYPLDSLIAINKDFYIGIKALGIKSLNIGYDFNLGNKSKIFRRYSVNDPFSNPSASVPEGSLMIRPVFRKLKFKVGLDEAETAFSDLKIYPNPSRGIVHFKMLPENTEISIFNSMGKLVYSGEDKTIVNLDHTPPGLYFIQLNTKDKLHFHTEKIILAPY